MSDLDPPKAEGNGGISFGSYLRYFLGLGTWGFGGPIATVGYMQRDLVEKRKWLTEPDFLNGVALGQTMPGPLAAQVVMWVGFLQRGSIGALATAGTFILPSFILVLAVAAIYVPNQGLPIVQSHFYGIAPAVMAVIAVAAVKLARLTDKRDPKLWVISVAIGVVTAVTGAEVALLFIGAGLLMIVLEAPPKLRLRPRGGDPGAGTSGVNLVLVGSGFKVLTGTAAGGIAGATVVLSRGVITDWKTVLIAVAALGFVLRFKNREPMLVLAAAAAGILLHGV